MIHRFTLSIYTVGLKLLVTFVQFTRFEKTTTLAIEGPSSLDWKIATCSPFISLGSKCWYQAFVSLQAVSWVRKLETARRILWKVFASGEVSVKLSFRFHWSNNSLSGKPNLQIKKGRRRLRKDFLSSTAVECDKSGRRCSLPGKVYETFIAEHMSICKWQGVSETNLFFPLIRQHFKR